MIHRVLSCAALLCAASAVQAQERVVHITATTGMASATSAYQSNCGHSSISASLDMRLGGRLFPYGSVDHLVGAGGGDVLCIPGIGAGTPGGGLRLEGATRLLLGVGARSPHGPIQAEVTLGVGGINGHPGYSVRGTETAKRVLPHIGAGFSLVIVRHVVLAFDPGWTRLTNSWLPDQGTSETKTSWQRMQIWRIGLRLGVPENQKESSH